MCELYVIGWPPALLVQAAFDAVEAAWFPQGWVGKRRPELAKLSGMRAPPKRLGVKHAALGKCMSIKNQTRA